MQFVQPIYDYESSIHNNGFSIAGKSKYQLKFIPIFWGFLKFSFSFSFSIDYGGADVVEL